MQWSVIPMSTAIGMKGSKATISKRCRSIPHVANILMDFDTVGIGMLPVHIYLPYHKLVVYTKLLF